MPVRHSSIKAQGKPNLAKLCSAEEMGSICPAVGVLLQAKAFVDQALQAGLVEDIEGEFLVGEHGESCALGAGCEFGGFFHGEIVVLADDRHHHAHHDLQAPDVSGFLFLLAQMRRELSPLPGTHSAPVVLNQYFDAPAQLNVALIAWAYSVGICT
jgi:hypothetical protein